MIPISDMYKGKQVESKIFERDSKLQKEREKLQKTYDEDELELLEFAQNLDGYSYAGNLSQKHQANEDEVLVEIDIDEIREKHIS